MSRTDLQSQLADKAKARGLAIPAEDAKAVTAGASWLRDCLDKLRQAGLSK